MQANIEKVLIYIAQNFSLPLQVEELAAKANLSAFHFHRVFKQATGFTPQKYLEKIRLENAAHILAIQPTIKKIHLAFENGFTSPSSFNRSFKNYYGQSPSSFIKNRDISFAKIDFENPLTVEKMEKIDICYLPKSYLKTKLLKPNYTLIEEQLGQTTFKRKRPMYGIFLDAPFHVPLAQCRYLMGQETNDKAAANFQIDAGYYTRVKIKGSIQEMLAEVLSHYENLSRNGYSIMNPIGVEKYTYVDDDRPFNFSTITRELFIPVCKQPQTRS